MNNKIFKNRILDLINNGQELNINKINRANNFLKEKQKKNNNQSY